MLLTRKLCAMDLKGAEISNILNLCRDMGSSDEQKPLRINIPHYQRPYKWDETRITNLIDDFDKNSEEGRSGKEYFVGSVVLVNNSPEGDGWHDVIDGQQRITTVFLLNFIRFLLLRAQTEDRINCRAPANIVGLLGSLIDCYVRLLGSDKKKDSLDNLKRRLSSDIDDIDPDNQGVASQTWSRLLQDYQEHLGLPERIFDDSYNARYKSTLSAFLADDCLALRYSRASYNIKLREALSSIVLLADSSAMPSIVSEYNGDDEIVLQYISALNYEFDTLCKHAIGHGDKPREAADKLIAYIDEMIESLKFCVILTGNENDAYTLFEVLNDRAMEVDDLDLIKNLFLRVYCTTSGESETLVDKTVGEIDTQWGEMIFRPGLTKTRLKMISYLGAVYLTADSSIHSNKTERFREVIDAEYFKTQYKGKRYTTDCIRRDITIYQMIGTLFETYGLPAANKDTHALEAEISDDSITYKTLHLLNALGQDGVMAAVVNLIIRLYMDKMSAEHRDALAIDSFKGFLYQLKSKSSYTKAVYSTIHEWSFELWKATLLSEKYDLPRELAVKIISAVCSAKSDIMSVTVSASERDRMVSSFQTWVSEWRYKKPQTLLKTKILFCELIHCSRTKDKSKLTFSKMSVSINTEKLQLDHLDAQNPNDAIRALYYTPEDPNAQRSDTIDGLGNMMILSSDENNGKGNKPLEDALGYYDAMCPDGHWLIDEIRYDLDYDGNYKTVPFGIEQRKVPTDQFFTMRKEQLRKYFLAVLSRGNITDSEVAIS